MSTATLTPTGSKQGANDFGQPQYTTVRKDVAFGFELKTDGKKEAVVLDVDKAKELEDQGKFVDGNVITTTITLPTNWAAIREYENKTYKDEKGQERDKTEVLNDLVTLFRTGMSAKASNRRNQRLLETDEKGNFTFDDSGLKDGVLDLTDEITSPSKRVFKTPEEKIWDSLSNLDMVTRKSMFDVYLSSIGRETGVYPVEA